MPQIKVKCQKCGREYSVHRYRANKTKYCSISCQCAAKVAKGLIGFQKGHAGFFEHHSEATKIKIGMKSKGRAITQEQKEKLRLVNLGKKLSPETKEKMREAHKGKGNYLWKGDDVSYGGLHYWVRRWLGKAKKCSVCGREGNGRLIQWANKDHSYKRNLADWIPLCFKCHAEYDKKLGLRKYKNK